jgi:putative oxidoreductase
LFNLERTVNKLNQARFKELPIFWQSRNHRYCLQVFHADCIALMLGFEPKYAAIILAMVLIPITITVQIGQMSTIGLYLKNSDPGGYCSLS